MAPTEAANNDEGFVGSSPQNAPCSFAPDEGAHPAPLLAALRLAGSAKDEERFVGASLAVQHFAGILVTDAGLRTQLVEALGADFVKKALASSAPYRRIGLALVRVLVVDDSGARHLHNCVPQLAEVCVAAVEPAPQGDQQQAPPGDTEGSQEAAEALEALRQFVNLVAPTDPVVKAATTRALKALVAVLRDPNGSGVLGPAMLVGLALARELPRASCAGEFLETACLSQGVGGTEVQALALGGLAEHLESGGRSSRLVEVIGEALAANIGPTLAESAAWPCTAALLRLAAAALGQRGIALLGDAQPSALGRLRSLLRLASGEFRLGLEGRLPVEALCGACMFLEAAVLALGNEAEKLEDCGDLELVTECMRIMHRTVGDCYEYCELLLDQDASKDVPPQLPLVARVIAVWQVEDPVRFEQEFRRSLVLLSRMSLSEFETLVPCIHELQDWHLTPAFAKVLELADQALSSEDTARRAFRPCALMLTEVALDAAVVLHEAPVPEAPASSSPASSGSGLMPVTDVEPRAADFPVPFLADLSRPVARFGAQRLASWSRHIWCCASKLPGLSISELNAAAVLCGALLVSVPCTDAEKTADTAQMWARIADGLLSGPTCAAEAATWRLTVRLCGFVLDRHPLLGQSLAGAAALRRSKGSTWLPPAMADALSAAEDVDEWKSVDMAALSRLRDFIMAAVPGVDLSRLASCEPLPRENLDEMD